MCSAPAHHDDKALPHLPKKEFVARLPGIFDRRYALRAASLKLFSDRSHDELRCLA